MEKIVNLVDNVQKKDFEGIKFAGINATHP